MSEILAYLRAAGPVEYRELREAFPQVSNLWKVLQDLRVTGKISMAYNAAERVTTITAQQEGN